MTTALSAAHPAATPTSTPAPTPRSAERAPAANVAGGGPGGPGSQGAAESGAERANRLGARFMARIVFGFLGMSVLVHGVALVYVFNANTDIVRSDYYQAGERYDQELALRTKASTLPFAVALRGGATGRVTLALANATSPLRAATGRAMLYRPGDATLDRVLPLVPVASATDVARWQTPPSAIPVGRWRVRVAFDAPHALAFERDTNVD